MSCRAKFVMSAVKGRPAMVPVTVTGWADAVVPSYCFVSVTALIGFVAQPGIVALFGSGKSEMEGRVGYTYGTMIKRVCAIGWVFTGVLLAALVAQQKIAGDEMARLAQNRELAFGSAMRALLPTGLVGLMFAAIFSSPTQTDESRSGRGDRSAVTVRQPARARHRVARHG